MRRYRDMTELPREASQKAQRLLLAIQNNSIPEQGGSSEATSGAVSPAAYVDFLLSKNTSNTPSSGEEFVHPLELYLAVLKQAKSSGLSLPKNICSALWENGVMHCLWNDTVLPDCPEEESSFLFALADECALLAKELSGYDARSDWDVTRYFSPDKDVFVFSDYGDGTAYKRQTATIETSGVPSADSVQNNPRGKGTPFLSWLRAVAGKEKCLSFAVLVIASTGIKSDDGQHYHPMGRKGKFMSGVTKNHSGWAFLAFVEAAVKEGLNLFDAKPVRQIVKDGLWNPPPGFGDLNTGLMSLVIQRLDIISPGMGKVHDKHTGALSERKTFFECSMERILDCVDTVPDNTKEKINAFSMTASAAVVRASQGMFDDGEKWIKAALKNKRVKSEQRMVWEEIKNRAAVVFGRTGIPSSEPSSAFHGSDEEKRKSMALYHSIDKFLYSSFAIDAQEAEKLLNESPLISSREFLFGCSGAGAGKVPPGVKILALGGQISLPKPGDTPYPFETAARVFTLSSPALLPLDMLDAKTQEKHNSACLWDIAGFFSRNFLKSRKAMLKSGNVLEEIFTAKIAQHWFRIISNGDYTFADMLSIGIAKEKHLMHEAWNILKRKDLWAGNFRSRLGLAAKDEYPLTHTDCKLLAHNLKGILDADSLAEPVSVMFSWCVDATEAKNVFEQHEKESVISGTPFETTLVRQYREMVDVPDFRQSKPRWGMCAEDLKSGLARFSFFKTDLAKKEFPLDVRTLGAWFWTGHSAEYAALCAGTQAFDKMGGLVQSGISNFGVQKNSDFWDNMRDIYLSSHNLEKSGQSKGVSGDTDLTVKKERQLLERYLDTLFTSVVQSPSCASKELLLERIPFTGKLIESLKGENTIECGGLNVYLSIISKSRKHRMDIPHNVPLMYLKNNDKDISVPVWMILSAGGFAPALPSMGMIPVEADDMDKIRNDVVGGSFLPKPAQEENDKAAFPRLNLANPVLYEHWLEKQLYGTPSGRFFGQGIIADQWVKGALSGSGGNEQRGMLDISILYHLLGRKNDIESSGKDVQDYAGELGSLCGRLFFKRDFMSGVEAKTGVAGRGIVGAARIIDMSKELLEREDLYFYRNVFCPFAEKIVPYMSDNANLLRSALDKVDPSNADFMKEAIDMADKSGEFVAALAVRMKNMAENVSENPGGGYMEF